VEILYKEWTLQICVTFNAVHIMWELLRRSLLAEELSGQFRKVKVELSLCLTKHQDMKTNCAQIRSRPWRRMGECFTTYKTFVTLLRSISIHDLNC
jgi:hypothetical protein